MSLNRFRRPSLRDKIESETPVKIEKAEAVAEKTAKPKKAKRSKPVKTGKIKKKK